MTTDEIKAEYLDAIDEVGEDVVIRTYVAGSETYSDSTVRARVVEFSARSTGRPDRAGRPQADHARRRCRERRRDAGRRHRTARCVVRGKELQIKAVDDNTRRVAGVLMAYELTVGG